MVWTKAIEYEIFAIELLFTKEAIEFGLSSIYVHGLIKFDFFWIPSLITILGKVAKISKCANYTLSFIE